VRKSALRSSPTPCLTQTTHRTEMTEALKARRSLPQLSTQGILLTTWHLKNGSFA
jgi:hypothetical protein